MTFNEYQEVQRSTASYGSPNLLYPALGLGGEAGEVLEKIKKNWRNLGVAFPSQYTNEMKEALAKELGDVLWYVSAIAGELEIDLDDVAQANINKLLDRRARGVIKSEGDNR